MRKLIPEQFTVKAHPALFDGRGGAKNEEPLFQSTIDIHILNIPVYSGHALSKRATAAFISAALLFAATKLRRLALCAFIKRRK